MLANNSFGEVWLDERKDVWASKSKFDGAENNLCGQGRGEAEAEETCVKVAVLRMIL